MHPRPKAASLAITLLLMILAGGQAIAADDHGFHRHHAAISAGGMTPLDEKGETSLALGVDYEYRFDERWGAGVVADAVLGSHKRAALFATGVSFRPTPRLRVGTGPGFELVEKDKPDGGTKNKAYFVWGFHGYYEFHMGNYAVGPVIFLDFVGETETNVTYALSIGRGW